MRAPAKRRWSGRAVGGRAAGTPPERAGADRSEGGPRAATAVRGGADHEIMIGEAGPLTSTRPKSQAAVLDPATGEIAQLVCAAAARCARVSRGTRPAVHVL